MSEHKNTYRTVKERSEGFYKEKGSKFIGIASRCYSEEEAKQLLDQWHTEHSQAGHLCYAYRIGLEGEKYRANDDGEPANSAGAPILGQLQSFDLTNTLIGVVRYYGGTKLGVGGLINAYRTAAKDAIEATDVVEMEVFLHVQLDFQYADMVGVMNCLKRWNIEMDRHTFENACEIECSLPLTTEESILAELNVFETLKITKLGIY
ncbi:MAG: YigZ family protein [bacterium]|nr:YigZ family protein [bacterium]